MEKFTTIKKDYKNIGENKDKKIIESFIKFVEIKSKSELLNLLKEYDSNEKKKTGFWLFDEALKKIQKCILK